MVVGTTVLVMVVSIFLVVAVVVGVCLNVGRYVNLVSFSVVISSSSLLVVPCGTEVGVVNKSVAFEVTFSLVISPDLVEVKVDFCVMDFV